jgi:hypothetical protein
LSEQKKWAEKLSSKCGGVSSAFLASALEELSESCYGDAKTSKSVIEELTLSCHMNEADLRKFISDVSKSCPMDVKKLKNEVIKAKGKKDLAFQAIMKSRVGST